MSKPVDYGLTGLGQDVYLDAKSAVRQIRRMRKPVIENLSAEQKEAFGEMLRELKAAVEGVDYGRGQNPTLVLQLQFA